MPENGVAKFAAPFSVGPQPKTRSARYEESNLMGGMLS
jgi:hypothetical protein